MGTLSDCCYLKVNLKGKLYQNVNSTYPKVPKQNIKTFLVEVFPFAFSCENLREFSNRPQWYTVLMGLGGGGETDS
jgi:hypothetical protein